MVILSLFSKLATGSCLYFCSVQIIMIYEIKLDGVLQSICTIMVEGSPWSLAFDNFYHLWVCQANEANPVICCNWNEINNSVSNLHLSVYASLLIGQVTFNNDSCRFF